MCCARWSMASSAHARPNSLWLAMNRSPFGLLGTEFYMQQNFINTIWLQNATSNPKLHNYNAITAIIIAFQSCWWLILLLLMMGQLEFKENRNRSRNGKREQERKTGTGICKNKCYSSDSLPVKFTELCKPSRLSVHHTISASLHKTVYWLMPLAICYNYTILLANLTPHEYAARCLTIWLNLLKFSV